MVYKKFGDKILSLSSLLLAGVFLPGGCECEKGNQSEAETKQEKGTVVGDASGSTGKPASGAGQVVSSYYIKACKDFFSHLYDELQSKLSHLDKKPIAPLSSIELGEKDGKKLKASVERLFKNFQNIKFASFLPETLQKNFFDVCSNPKYHEFRTGASKSGTQHKFAYATALSNLLTVANKLHDTHAKGKELKGKGAKEEERKSLVKEIDDLQLMIAPANGKSIFTKTHKFPDAKQSKLLSGDQLVRFFTDTDEKGITRPPTSQYLSGLKPAVLDDKVGVLVNTKTSDSDRQLKTLSTPSGSHEVENLNVRGAGISSSWFVKEESKDEASKNVMPQIDPFPNFGLASKFNVNTLTVGSAADDDDMGIEKKQLSGGQLLFTLFRGEGDHDIFKLARFSSSCVELSGNAENFKKLIEIAKSPSGEEFAKFLYQHIENIKQEDKNNDLFCIPDVDLIKRHIFSGLDLTNNDLNTIAANDQGNSSKKVMNDEDPFGIPSKSFVTKVVDNILENIFNAIVVDSSDRVRKVKALLTNSTLDGSTASFAQKIGFQILHEIVQGTKNQQYLAEASSAGTEKNVVDMINQQFESNSSIMNNVIVYKTEGKYQLTSVSRKIKSWLTSIDDALSRKHGKAFITYGDFQDKAGNALDIDAIRKSFQDDCNALKSIFSAPVDDFLNAKGKTVDYSTDFPSLLSIVGPNTGMLDSIRLEYQNAINKTPSA